jgi:hypothetical protein
MKRRMRTLRFKLKLGCNCSSWECSDYGSTQR